MIDLIRRTIWIQIRKRLPIETRWGMALAVGFRPSLSYSLKYRRLVLCAAKQTPSGYRVCLYSVDGSVDKVFVNGIEKPRTEGRQLL